MKYRTAFVFFVSSALLLCTYLPSGLAEEVALSASEKRSAELNEKGAEHAHQGNMASAKKVFEEAIKENPANLTAVFNLASVYLSEKEEQQAIKLLNEYTKKYPVDPGLYARLGDANFSNKDLKSAAAAYEKAIELDPEYPQAAARLGTVYAMSDRIDDAIQVTLKAVELEPKNGELLSNLSNLFLATGDTGKAVSTAKRALQVRASKDTYLTLGSAYESMKDFKNAVIAYERAKDLGESSPELSDRIATLKKLSSTN